MLRAGFFLNPSANKLYLFFFRFSFVDEKLIVVYKNYVKKNSKNTGFQVFTK